MSNDLISKKEVLEIITPRLNSSRIGSLENQRLYSISEEVKNLHTAYDLDKVIEQINNLDIKTIPRYKGGVFGDYEGTDYYIKKSEVLEILKAGLMK